MYYCYILINSITNKPFYVGKGTGRRMYMHQWMSENKNHYNKHLENTINMILKNGGKIIYNVILESNLESECLSKEIEMINVIGNKNLCNLTDGGDGISGYKHTEKTKSDLSIKNFNMSDETKDKIRQSTIKRFSDPDERLRISKLTKLGMTPEIRKCMSDLKKGKTPPNKGNDSRKTCVCCNCGEDFLTYVEKKYCSGECRNIFIKNQNMVKGHCEYCGKEMIYKKYKKRITCDMSCRNKLTARRKNVNR